MAYEGSPSRGGTSHATRGRVHHRERGDVTQGIGDGERLALGIHRDRGGLAQRIGNRSEIAHRIIAESGRMAQRIGDGEG